MRKQDFQRVFFVSTLVTLMLAAGCKTTAPNEDTLKAGTPSGNDDIPLLTVATLAPGTITKIIAVARKDAVAIFGGKALFHMAIFDNSIESGPCTGIFGARVIFANPNDQAEERRAYAMFTIDPVPSSPTTCGSTISASPKWAAELETQLAGTQNMEKALGGIGGINTSLGIKLSIAEAVKKLKAENPKFEGALGVSIMNPSDSVMKANPWALIYGLSCGESGIGYVNLTTGKVVQAARPMKTDCQ